MPEHGTELVAAGWPAHGPHSPELVSSAAGAVEQLVRYLNRATLPRYHAVTDAGHGVDVLGSLETAARHEMRLCTQLAAWARRLAADPTLRDPLHGDNATRSRSNAAGVARLAAAELTDAVEHAEQLADDLEFVRSMLDTLTHAHPGGDQP